MTEVWGTYWRPIETAPKDGTYVLVAGRYDSPHVAGFLPLYRGGQRRWISVGCDGAAIRSQDDFGTEYQEAGPLTHWMPLPDAPKI